MSKNSGTVAVQYQRLSQREDDNGDENSAASTDSETEEWTTVGRRFKGRLVSREIDLEADSRTTIGPIGKMKIEMYEVGSLLGIRCLLGWLFDVNFPLLC